MTKQDDAAIAAANEKPTGLPLMGYKYIPSVEGPPDTAYAISTPSDRKLEQMWLGKPGRFYYGDPTREDVGAVAGVMDALKTLPVSKVLGVSRSRGSSVLRVDLSRRLR